ncbi:MAG TPA: hypothetical protein VFV43_02860 [Limnobacter sp.]|nr:hypothetical protein [Limnobacter sp.]
MPFCRVFARALCGLLGLFPALVHAQQSDACWLQHRATVYEWICAHQSLPDSGRDFALSVVVVDSPRSLMVIDSGATASVGESLARAVRIKFGSKPVWILNTQPKPEHVLGNVGFGEVIRDTLKEEETLGQRIVAGKLTSDLMVKRCPECIKNFAERMGSNSVQGTQPVVPQRLLRAERGHLGTLNSDWVPWKYRLYKDLETEEALILQNRDLNLRWVGSAVQDRLVPDLYDGDVVARIDFLARLYTVLKSDETLLTSHGALNRDTVKRNLDYFVDLHRRVLVGLEEGVSEVELIKQLSEPAETLNSTSNSAVYVSTLPDPGKSRDLETHQLNIQRIYRQTEPLVF